MRRKGAAHSAVMGHRYQPVDAVQFSVPPLGTAQGNTPIAPLQGAASRRCLLTTQTLAVVFLLPMRRRLAPAESTRARDTARCSRGRRRSGSPG